MDDTTAKAPRILVVEDESAIRTLITFACAGAGLEVESVDSAIKAQSLIDSSMPDLVLLDYMLPDLIIICLTVLIGVGMPGSSV